MANLTKRPDGRWRARYRDSAGKEHARHFTRKVDAQSWLDSVTTAVRTGSYVDPGRSKITVSVMAEEWLAGKINLRPSTKARYENALYSHAGQLMYLGFVIGSSSLLTHRAVHMAGRK